MKKLLLIVLFFMVVLPLHASQYPQHVQANFINGCMLGGGTRNYCVCTLNWIQRNMSLNNYLAMESRMSVGNTTDADIQFLRRAGNSCR